MDRETLRRSYHVYRKAYDGSELGLAIAGRLALRVDGRPVPADESFPSIDGIMMENFGVLGEDDGTGSILKVSQWSLLVNDSWLLGVMHSGTEIHFASPLTLSNLWDDSRRSLTVLGREFIGVTSSGYQIFDTRLESIAQNVDPRKTADTSFATYMTARNNITGKNDLQNLLHRRRPRI